MNFLTQLVVSTLAIIVTAFILPGVDIDNAFTGVIVAFVLAILNAIIKPVLIILTIPITLITMGLFLLIINAGMILLASNIVSGFQVDGFWTALFFSIILSLATSFLNRLSRGEKKDS